MKEVDLKISGTIICHTVISNLEKWISRQIANDYFLNLIVLCQVPRQLSWHRSYPQGHNVVQSKFRSLDTSWVKSTEF